jgi:NitT/TauT family transport system permease protein
MRHEPAAESPANGQASPLRRIVEARALHMALFLAALVGVWEGVVRLGFWPEYLFPSPFTVFARVGDGLQDHSIPVAVGNTMRRMAIGYGSSLAAGVLLGLLIARFRLVEDTLGSLMLGLQALPSIVWLPLALIWIGLNDTAIIFVVIMGSLLSITLATADGVKNIPPLYHRTARTLGARGPALYWRVVLPASLPTMITGMKLGWSFAWRSLMAAELLFVTAGLGHLLEAGRQLNDIPQVMAIMVVIVALGLLVDRLVFAILEERVRRRWGLTGIR